MNEAIIGRINQLTNYSSPSVKPHSDEITMTEAKIRKIVNEEIDRRWRDVLKATYPPELWQALQSKFPDILSDSNGQPRKLVTFHGSPSGIVIDG